MPGRFWLMCSFERALVRLHALRVRGEIADREGDDHDFASFDLTKALPVAGVDGKEMTAALRRPSVQKSAQSVEK